MLKTIMLVMLSSLAVVAADRPIQLSANADRATVLDIKHAHGTLVVQGWDKDEVKLEGKITATGRMKNYIDECEVTITTEGDTVFVNTKRPKTTWGWGSLSIDYTLYAPRNLEVIVKMSHGSSTISQLDNSIDGRFSHGSVTINEIRGSLKMKNAHGSTKVTAITGDVNIDSSHGSVKVDDVGGSAFVNNSHGSITAHAVVGSVTADVRHGSLKVFSDEVSGEYKLKSSHGSVALHIPKSQKINLDARASHGSVGGSYVGKNSADKVVINNGGPSVNIKSSHGSIKVHAD